MSLSKTNRGSYCIEAIEEEAGIEEATVPESFDDFLLSNIPAFANKWAKVKLLYDVHSMHDFGFKTSDFLSKLKKVTEQCSKGNEKSVIKSLDSLVKHETFKDACKVEGLKGLKELADDPAKFLESQGFGGVEKLLGDFRKHANEKIFKAELAQTAFAICNGAWVLYQIYKAVTTYNRLNTEFTSISKEINKFQSLVEKFVTKVRKHLQPNEDEVVNFFDHLAVECIHSEGLALIEKYKRLCSRITTFKATANCTIATIRELKRSTQHNTAMAASSMARTAISHFVTDGLQTSKMGIGLGFGALIVGGIAVAAQFFTSKRADKEIKNIEKLVEKMLENEARLDQSHRKLLTAMGRINPEFQAEYDRLYGIHGRT